MEMAQLGKLVIVAGVVLVVLGVIIVFAGRIPFLGQLPGDIHYRRGSTTIFVPLATMLLLSLILTLALNLLFRR
jgi:hypothetical protein